MAADHIDTRKGMDLYEIGYRHAISTYNKAVAAAEDVPEALAPVLLNRAMAEFKLGNFGRALGDLEKSLSLMPGNAKAHYRAVLCAVALEKFDVALRHCDEGENVVTANNSAQGRRDVALFKQQRWVMMKAMEKSNSYQSEKERTLQVERARKEKIALMVDERGITMGLPLFSQQRRYSCTEPRERDGVWHWPVLLVYPEEIARPGGGDQSDFLEDVAETTKIEEILEWIFGEEVEAPSWDVNRVYRSTNSLQMRYRTEWTLKIEDADSDEEESFCGSTLPEDEIGHWMDVSSSSSLKDVLRKRNYIVPLFPVFYVIPREIELG
ncbi:unnamed protein product [Chondrus crispus]|uniref:Uncharacterized protein n=1 Tax=Chondrus crispus TaxID=2769 RepID=R7Q622_CHOCR|nr:unnamed protein product [Chondrus crispus]CDF33459.1 unnamed protein product [Chondrus crispus]|eukprot:XP_005713262.1 unnamed protein product [Chondrus crispus]